MTSLVHQRCTLHGHREAVAICPECRHPFCRECVTEHDDRIVCASCIRKLVEQKQASRRGPRIPGGFRATTGFVVAWLIFYLVGQTLLRLPSSFHEGALWRPEYFEAFDEQ